MRDAPLAGLSEVDPYRELSALLLYVPGAVDGGRAG
ncbi:hypothetical protein BC739_000039 [Kutzneria viridogrisea]|uniref:Uncharacterized protein n=1 Tax=Kutzneria viridogrisea TaxID=47990 RepID=A0ABR6B7J1_9PSEU|nr:hypothetical protein [Kutzneria viridogrisea]